jgi:hypothetical protein
MHGNSSFQPWGRTCCKALTLPKTTTLTQKSLKKLSLHDGKIKRITQFK